MITVYSPTPEVRRSRRKSLNRLIRALSPLIDLFSEEDRKYIAKWQKNQNAKYDDADLTPDSRLSINLLKGNKDQFNDYGDIDDRVVSFSPGVIVDNEEFRHSFKAVKGSVIIVGSNIMNDDQYVILSRQDFKLDLPKREKSRWEGAPFKCRYDPDYGGFDYGGYLVVLRNKKGEVVQTKGSRTAWEKNAENLLKAKKRKGYSVDFKHARELYTTYGLY